MVAAKFYFSEVAKLPSMDGKPVAITGTTSGTGLVLARTLLDLGCPCIIALNRNTTKAAQALQTFELGTAGVLAPEVLAKVQHVECDLLSFDSVRKAAERTLEIAGDAGIYALVNNAGVMMLDDKASVDGYDVQMQCNVLSAFLLSQLLLPALEKYHAAHGEARIVNHSSVARLYARHGKLNKKYFEKRSGKLGGNTAVAKFMRYTQSKLGDAVLTYAMKDFLEQKYGKPDSGVKCLVAHPGVAHTELASHMDFDIMNPGMFLFKTFVFNAHYQDQKDGALGVIKCVCQPDLPSGAFVGPGRTGYVGNPAPFKVEARCTSKANKELLWEMAEKAVGAYTL